MASDKAEAAKAGKQGGFSEIVKVVVQALLLALVIRTFLFQPFNIPSGSMMNTLLIGDYLFVSKFSYGYSRYSFPYGIVPFDGRVWAAEPERGDVVVFKLPTDNSTDYIKRVVGLPGDSIQMIGGVLHINGTAVKRERIADFVEVDQYGVERRTARFLETLPNGVSYDTLEYGSGDLYDDTPVYKVPAGHYFMMGDNRDNSKDSRYLDGVGYVPFENLVGKAQVIFFSVGEGEPLWKVWLWPWTVRWNRIFDPL